jgi:predicted MPP superfamily phosphohydrolase
VLTRRQFLALGGAAVAGAAGVGLYAWQVEPHWVEVVRRAMPLEFLPPALEGRTLLQISDIHVGPKVSSSYLIETFDQARDLSPDFVAFTGDFVSYRSANEYRELARVLKHAPNGKLGTVGSLGNHDYGFGWKHIDVADRVASVATDAGIRVLRNEVQTIGGIQFAGLSDLWSPQFEPTVTLASLMPKEATIVLSHNPDVQDLPVWDGVRAWVLAGHTHGGQVKPPFLPPPLLPVKNKRYAAGEYVIAPGRTLYINRGLGHLIQVRFNVRPELTLFTLRNPARVSAEG